MKLSIIHNHHRVELLKGDVKLTETVNFCETIEESEGEEGKDSSENSSINESPTKKNTLPEKKTFIPSLNNNHNKEGRNGVDMKRFYTVH